MKLQSTVFTTLVTTIFAQRPANTTICDFWTPAILGSNTASSQALLITIFINTVVLGNYTTPNVGIPVGGFASPGIYNDTQVALLPYFTGAFNSTNLGGSQGSSKLFLDGGGAMPLTKNMSSNGDVNSAQYKLLNHIYEYFGTLMGCSLQGGPEFPSYQGRTSMYEVHRYMDLDKYQMGFFIELCVSSMKSLGISATDAVLFGNTLTSFFDFRCSPPALVPNEPATDPELQSVCIAKNCPLDPKADCVAYPENGVALVPVNLTEAQSGGNNETGGANGTSSAPGGPVQTSDSMKLRVYSAIILTTVAFISFVLLM